MVRRAIDLNSIRYIFSPDDKVPLSERIWGIVMARTVDEITDEPPRGTVIIKTDFPYLFHQKLSDGFIGLVGIPGRVLPALASDNYLVRFTIQAEGFLLRKIAVVLPTDQRTTMSLANSGDSVITLNSIDRISVGEALIISPPGGGASIVRIRSLDLASRQVYFTPGLIDVCGIGTPVIPVIPDDFTTVDLGNVVFHREPILIRGRVVRRTGNTTQAINGANVSVTGIWKTLLAVNQQPNNADPPNLVSLQPPLYFDRVAATGRLRRRAMTIVGGQETRLNRPVIQGSRHISLINRVGLSPGHILQIDAANPDLTEYLTINTIVGDNPAEASLTYPVMLAHREDAIVSRVTPMAPGPNKSLSQDAIAGDCCVFLSTISGLATANVVEIFGGADPPEYHRVDRLTTTSDANGYFRLPPLSRVAQINLEATDGGSTVKLTISPDYSVRENRADLVF